jgi:RimJ/RimL family protein N-acetyltransferase
MSAESHFHIPRLTTGRLLLREARRSDFDTFAADNADPLARTHLPALDRRMAWRVFCSGMGAWVIDGAGWWMVELRATGEAVGMVGAFYREGPPGEARGDIELGWTMFRKYWSRGFATEAATAALAFSFDTLGVTRAIAHIDATNVASLRVGEHLGMRFEQEVTFYGERTGRYAIEASLASSSDPPSW